MRRGEVWFAATPGGDRPVLVLTCDPVADRVDSIVVTALTPSDCVVNFDNVHTLPRELLRHRVITLTPARMAQACAALAAATGC